MTQSNPETSYFDLHISGVGYLNRVRTVAPKRGDSFLSCSISAIVGPKNKVEYRHFDVKVAGSDAQHLIRRCEDAANDPDRKVLIGFRLGDLWIDKFTYRSGEKQGQQGVSLKARLLYIAWIKVDGELVYKAERKPANDGAESNDSELPPQAANDGAESNDPALLFPGDSSNGNDTQSAEAA